MQIPNSNTDPAAITDDEKEDINQSSKKSGWGWGKKYTLNCDKGHVLQQTSQKKLNYEQGYECKICLGKYTKGASKIYHCFKCGYDCCPKCYDSNTKNKTTKDLKSCAGKHGLKKFNTTKKGHICGECHDRWPINTKLYGCRVCDFDLCRNCAVKGSGNVSSPQPQQKGTSMSEEKQIEPLSLLPDDTMTCYKGHLLKKTTQKRLYTVDDVYENQNGIKCKICLLEYQSGTVYHCSLCRYDCCRWCFEANTKYKVVLEELKPCPGNHGLLKFKTTIKGHSCGQCKKMFPVKAVLYGCRRCNFDLCPDCVIVGGDEGETLLSPKHIFHCDEGHVLSKTSQKELFKADDTYEAGYECSICLGSYKSGVFDMTLYHCNHCRIDCCPNCYDANTKNRKRLKDGVSCPGHHELKQYNTTSKDNSCDKCEAQFGKNTTMFGCRICVYDLCKKCAVMTLKEKFDDKMQKELNDFMEQLNLLEPVIDAIGLQIGEIKVQVKWPPAIKIKIISTRDSVKYTIDESKLNKSGKVIYWALKQALKARNVTHKLPVYKWDSLTLTFPACRVDLAFKLRQPNDTQTTNKMVEGEGEGEEDKAVGGVMQQFHLLQPMIDAVGIRFDEIALGIQYGPNPKPKVSMTIKIVKSKGIWNEAEFDETQLSATGKLLFKALKPIVKAKLVADKLPFIRLAAIKITVPEKMELSFCSKAAKQVTDAGDFEDDDDDGDKQEGGDE